MELGRDVVAEHDRVEAGGGALLVDEFEHVLLELQVTQHGRVLAGWCIRWGRGAGGYDYRYWSRRRERHGSRAPVSECWSAALLGSAEVLRSAHSLACVAPPESAEVLALPSLRAQWSQSRVKGGTVVRVGGIGVAVDDGATAAGAPPDSDAVSPEPVDPSKNSEIWDCTCGLAATATTAMMTATIAMATQARPPPPPPPRGLCPLGGRRGGVGGEAARADLRGPAPVQATQVQAGGCP